MTGERYEQHKTRKRKNQLVWTFILGKLDRLSSETSCTGLIRTETVRNGQKRIKHRDLPDDSVTPCTCDRQHETTQPHSVRGNMTQCATEWYENTTDPTFSCQSNIRDPFHTHIFLCNLVSLFYCLVRKFLFCFIYLLPVCFMHLFVHAEWAPAGPTVRTGRSSKNKFAKKKKNPSQQNVYRPGVKGPACERTAIFFSLYKKHSKKKKQQALQRMKEGSEKTNGKKECLCGYSTGSCHVYMNRNLQLYLHGWMRPDAGGFDLNGR